MKNLYLCVFQFKHAIELLQTKQILMHLLVQLIASIASVHLAYKSDYYKKYTLPCN